MTTPTWQPGTLYAPGSLVVPLSAIAPVPDPINNGNFESGVTGWTLDAGFSIGQFGNGTHFDGTWSLQWNLSSTGRAINTKQTPVEPGQVITARGQVQQGASSAGQAGARVEIAWYDESDDLISYSSGNMVNSTSNQTWKQSTVTGTAPAGAAFARFSVYAFRNSGSSALWIDACSWDAVITSLPDGLVFRAVQANTGYSSQSEPVWPIVAGATVVDNEVTWQAVFASRVEWEASPILVSGDYEPDFPTIPDGTVVDGTIIWTAMNFRVTDEKCPQGPVVAIAASKIFCADDDIIAFSATVNPLDWSSEQDAGYLPFGLQTYGSTPVEAMGLYRSNLVAFNSEGYQMWQVDQDPANMALLDASPVACQYPRSVQPVSNDLVFLTPEGIRNIGIAGASTNLQAGYFGKQIDPLVLAKIRAGLMPEALFWPGTGQYWIFFGAEAFVLTMNGGAKDMSWSRYVFPDTVDDWALLDTDLYLRAGDNVWRVDDTVLVDDGQETVPGDPEFADVSLLLHCDGVNGSTSFPDASANALTVTSTGGVVTTTNPRFGTGALSVSGSQYISVPVTDGSVLDLDDGGDFTIEGWARITDAAFGGVQALFSYAADSGSALFRAYSVSGFITVQPFGFAGWDDITANAAVADNTWFHWAVCRSANRGYLAVNGTVKAATNANWTPGISFAGIPLRFGASSNTLGIQFALTGALDEIRITKGFARYTSNFTPATEPFPDVSDEVVTGEAFEGEVWWPYLDFGMLGREKMLEGFDLVCTGDVEVSVGYNQRDASLATPGYAVYGDTLPGTPIPLPVSGPSFQLRLTFGANQEWEFQAASLYLNDDGNPP